MTPLQKKTLELLRCFISICRKLDLTYYLVCGSALGAKKYGGFIPWDDDIDVALFREDYEILLREAPALLPEHLFLQDYRSEPAFPAIFAKLRDSSTTFLETSAAKLPINHGIYIDIFPLDGYPSQRREQRLLEIKKQCYRRLLSAAFEPNRPWKKLALLPLRLCGVHRRTQKIAAAYTRMIRCYPARQSAVAANHGNWQGKLDYCPTEYFGTGTPGTFEGLAVTLPSQVDSYLRQKYGDYEKDPPRSEQIGHHYHLILDTENSYRTYLAQSD